MDNMSFKKFDNSGQMLIIEVIIFSIMILTTLFFITQLSPTPVSTTDISQNKLKILADDTLRTIDSTPLKNYLFNSLLCMHVGLNDPISLANYLNTSFSSTSSFNGFNIYIGNGNNTILWYNGEKYFGKKTGEVIRSHRFIVLYYLFDECYPKKEIIPSYDGCIYDVILEIW